MPRALREFLLLLVLAAVPAALAGWLHPRPPQPIAAGLPELTAGAARDLAATQPVLWIDARPAEAFARGHIDSAIRLTGEEWETLLLPVMETWTPGSPVIVYCEGGGCAASQAVAARLQRELGIETIYVLTGGWPAWRQTNPN